VLSRFCVFPSLASKPLLFGLYLRSLFLGLRDSRNCFDQEIYNVVSEHHFGSSSLKNERAEVPSKSIQFSESWIKNKTVTYAACPRLTLSGFS
jgi:hypothetical protein